MLEAFRQVRLSAAGHWLLRFFSRRIRHHRLDAAPTGRQRTPTARKDNLMTTTATPLTAEVPVQAVQLHRRPPAALAHDGPWSIEAIQALLDKPFMDLLYEAQTVHRQHWPAGDVELATLLSVKTGGCPENCGYCPQSAEFDTGVKSEKLMILD